jgi:hypothetical protein
LFLDSNEGNVSTTMICTHVLNRGGRGVRSPLDRLLAHGSAYSGTSIAERAT